MPPPDTSAPQAAAPPLFTGYQRFVAGLLACLQFAVILDFMIMSPLGAVIMPDLKITTEQFGLVVSAYAFSAGVVGILTAGFADRFDRKKLLLFFYAGFVASTLWCGLAQTFHTLLMARIVTGVFAGVIGSVVMAIATDLFELRLRGRVMGVIQTAFAASQVLGLPVGLYLSNRWDWHAPFIAMAAFGAAGGLVIAWRMRPVADHLKAGAQHGALKHLLQTVVEPRHVTAFATTALLTTGGFMLMPFSSAFVVHTLGIPLESLPTIYLVTGMCTIFIGPLVGKLADRLGKLPVFMAGTAVTIVMVLVYTHLQAVSLPWVIVVNVLMFVGIFSRMIPFQALVSAVPAATQRGSFNAVNAAIQQLAGGLASLLAGHIVAFGADGKLLHFPVVGYVVAATSVVTATLVWRLQRDLQRAAAGPASAAG
ncbi:MFS transporter [Ideonella azotifigens]|uniref:MFS transporter n=2 Tax=Ideonella azotifigens TaxID=513160 RepID=A0ABP3VQD5_9BURK|nr:MFS transporter [Ideonella azotifigens]MCD2340362.1 MFS transporter [Ideonella azotifigens]